MRRFGSFSSANVYDLCVCVGVYIYLDMLISAIAHNKQFSIELQSATNISISSIINYNDVCLSIDELGMLLI